ncbi:CRAL/TRIO domain-containing protein, partial [Aspergillus heteromorphus CBS 117.55]
EEVKEEKEEEKKEEEEKPAQPEYLAKNPALSQFFDRLPSILSATSYNEMWGVSLKDSSDVPTVNVLIKFLRANEGNVKLAEEQLTKALQWRKEMNPIALADGHYSAEKFGGLGYVTKYPEANGKEVITTWNIYGSVKNVEATFGDSDEFIKWRVALMELAIKDLKLGEATVVIDYDGEDPYQMLQVHDYLNVSFLRLNPTIRAATKKTIEVFATAYPELLREKFFVNVPTIMGWMFAAMKVFLSKNTTRKFHPISNGANLAREFPSFKDQFPKPYGGNGPALQDGAWTVKLDQAEPAAPAEAE